jgi:putative transcriptional regulator
MPKLEHKLHIISRLHVLRAERRLSQEDLARAIGVTRGTIIAIEGGEYNPSLELAFRLARYFATDIHSIFYVGEGTNEKGK